jgi:hypothetical protein
MPSEPVVPAEAADPDVLMHQTSRLFTALSGSSLCR